MPAPGVGPARVHPPARRDDARLLRRQPDQLPAQQPGRDEQQPRRCGLRGVRPGVHGAHAPLRRRPERRRPRDGGPERAQLPRLDRGLHADRAAGAVRHLRGLRHGQRLDDDPAHQVAGGGAPPAVAQSRPVAQHPADEHLLAQRPQRLQPSGTGPDPERHQQARHRVAHLLPAGRQQPRGGRRPLLPHPEPRQPHRHRQAAAAAVPDPRRGAAHFERGASVWDWAGNENRATIPTSSSRPPATS